MQIGAAMKHDNGVNSAVFSPDQKSILTSSFDSTARLWDVVTKKQIASFKHEAPLTNAVFSPDSKWILTASRDSTACLWEIEGDLPLPE